MRRIIALAAALLIATSVHAGDTDPRFMALVGLARVKRDAGDLVAARRYFEQADKLLALDGLLLAEYFWVLSNTDAVAALSTGRTMLQRMPALHEVREQMIGIAAKQGDESLVTELATEGWRLTGDARWSRRLAESALRRNRPADAAAAYRAAINGTDAQMKDRIGLALSLEASQQYADAVAVWAAVPEAVREESNDWVFSRLRALASGAPAAVAGPELEAWLSRHPDHQHVREMLIEMWARAGRPDRALQALAPLLEGPERDRWTRREIDLATAAHDRRRAIEGLERLLHSQQANMADVLNLADLLLTERRYPRAEAVIDLLGRSLSGCDDRWMQLIDRVPDPRGTDLLVTAVEARRCTDRAQWLIRAIDRSVALSRQGVALSLVDRLPESVGARIEIQRLHGQLLLWTGAAGAAADVLARVVHTAPDDLVAREALIDAHRACRQPGAAWDTARPLLTAALTDDRRVMLAHLALEADHPDAVSGIVERLPRDRIDPNLRLSLTGRAQLALGHAAEAVRLLSRIPVASLSPPSALAFLDASIAMSGRDAAVDLSRTLSSETVEWTDVIARRAVLEAVAGRDAESDRLIRVLTRFDTTAAAIARTERALANESPVEALAALTGVPADDRSDDLRATALEGSGHLQEAVTIVERLDASRPAFVPLTIRRTELQWRLTPSAAAFQAVLELPVTYPGREDAALAAARALAGAQRHREALAVLSTTLATGAWTLESTLTAARSLHAGGRSADALALLQDLRGLSGSGALLRAQLTAVVRGADKAQYMFTSLAAGPRVTPSVFLVWAEATPAAAARAAILKRGVDRFPAHAELRGRLAAVQWAMGNQDAARETAQQTVTLDPRAFEAWFVLIDATAATRTRADLDVAIRRFAAAADGDLGLIVRIADRVSGMIREPDDPVLKTALLLLDGVIVVDQLAVARDLARGRLYAAGERWLEALSAIDAALGREPRSLPGRRLRADVLSWAGRHVEALGAYDEYLALAPQDLDALRQQARVAGWSGRYSEARKYYDALRRRFPQNRLVAAEARAKNDLFAGRWRAAADDYARWVALEPANSEARFEWAEALRAAGDAHKADAMLESLASDAGHRLATVARRRADLNRRPSLTLVNDVRSASGYEGARLLDLQQQGGSVTASFGRGGFVFSAEGTHVLALAESARRNGYRVAMTTVLTPSPTFRLEGTGAWWQFMTVDRPAIDLQWQAVWQPKDGWTLSGGLDRQTLFENLTTIDAGLSASGVFVAGARATPVSSISARLAQQAISDGNSRRRATVSVSRLLSERLPQIRLLAWGEALSYQHDSTTYFAPGSFLRADAGLEYNLAFWRPRFNGDRQRTLTTSYLFGTDNRGTLYHHPGVRLNLELSNGLALDAQAGWIRSTAYDESVISVGLRIGGMSVPR